MNNIKNIVFTFIAIVLVQYLTLAQTEDSEPGEFGGGDNPVDAPIDIYIWVLLVVGLGYVFYKYRSFLK